MNFNQTSIFFFKVISITLLLSIIGCNKSNETNIPAEIQLLESKYYLEFDIPISDIKVLEKFYKTKIGKNHLKELENKLGEDIAEIRLFKNWIDWIILYEKRTNEVNNINHFKILESARIDNEKLINFENQKLINSFLSMEVEEFGKNKQKTDSLINFLKSDEGILYINNLKGKIENEPNAGKRIAYSSIYDNLLSFLPKEK